jgi:hypothetical protein
MKPTDKPKPNRRTRRAAASTKPKRAVRPIATGQDNKPRDLTPQEANIILSRQFMQARELHFRALQQAGADKVTAGVSWDAATNWINEQGVAFDNTLNQLGIALGEQIRAQDAPLAESPVADESAALNG